MADQSFGVVGANCDAYDMWGGVSLGRRLGVKGHAD
jgi:hypothetical protein